MKTINDITSALKDTRKEMITFEAGQHYGFFLGKILFRPTTLAQAKKHIHAIRNTSFDNLLMCGEWLSVEEFLNENGFAGQYRFTKSGTMVRLENIQDYVQAIKNAFQIK